jgi:hypothetical protein
LQQAGRVQHSGKLGATERVGSAGRKSHPVTLPIRSLLAAALLACAACGRHDSRPTESADQAASDVQAAWDEFKSASLSNKGRAAANRVTSATHDYYAEIRDLALTATREQVQRMSIAKQVTVLGMRVRIDPEQLKNMSGRDLFIHAVDHGWIGKTSATDEGITGIVVTGDHARAEATNAGEPVGVYLHFIKEDGAWRLDMMQLMKVANAAFDAMQAQSGLNEEEFVTRVIETVTSERLSEDDWNAK